MSKYCVRLRSFCQYKDTPYCPTKYTYHPPVPDCKKFAYRAVEESLEKGE